MRSAARFAGHAIHPMLIVFPLGLLSTAVIFDIIYLFSDKENFSVTAGYLLVAGVISGPIAALFGWLDWFKIPSGTRAKRIGLLHGAGNIVVVVLFALSLLSRVIADDNWKPPVIGLILSFAGVGLAIFTAWLGGELVERLGIGVDEEANVNASNSFTTAPFASLQ
jgi:uncharacterized membrane protein